MSHQRRATWGLSLFILLSLSGLLFLAPLLTYRSANNARGPAVTATATYPCPSPTQELFSVRPLTSPTTLFTQEVYLDLGFSDAFTITTQSGVFTTAGFNAHTVTVQLMPNFTHTLTAQGHVGPVQSGNCIYGNYTMQTTVDENSNPLVIVQQAPNMTYRHYAPLVWH